MKWPFSAKPKDIKFLSVLGNFAVANPVILASTYRAKFLRDQAADKKFHKCPGMLDFYNSGYLILAHTDIHIKANSLGVVARLEGGNVNDEKFALRPFDFALVDGLAPVRDNVVKFAGKIPLPWSIQTARGVSAYVLPATVHSPFLDKLYVYAGVVDYDRFFTVNFVFTPLEACEFVIPAGTPLLHIIPFKRTDMEASCDKASPLEESHHWFNIPSRISNYYRKYLSRRKVYKMECPYEHRKLPSEREAPESIR